jgi:hypothetical protein
MHCGHARDRAFRHVYGHGHAVLLCHIADFFIFEDAPRCEQVRMDDRNAAGFDKGLEVFLQINIFSRADRYRCRICKLDVLVCILPWDQIFQPCDVVFFNALRQADACADPDMPDMVYGERDLIAYFTAHFN